MTTGSYDAWNNDREKFPALMKQLAEKATKAGAKVVFLTTRPVRSNVSDPFNAALQAMADGKSVFVLDQLAIDRTELKRRAANKAAIQFRKRKDKSREGRGYARTSQVVFVGRVAGLLSVWLDGASRADSTTGRGGRLGSRKLQLHEGGCDVSGRAVRRHGDGAVVDGAGWRHLG